MKNACYFLLVLLAFSSGTSALPAYPLKLSADKRILEDRNGVPFLINAQSAWGLIVALTRAEAETYLEDRRQKGFNAVVVMLISKHVAINGKSTLNRYGQAPFTSGTDFSTPSEAYFRHADSVINMAAAKGIAVLLAPAYLGYGCGDDEGWCPQMISNGAAKLRDYGRYVGNRYRTFDNILWLNGGDCNASGYGALDEVDAVAYGIKDADTVRPKLHTAHCNRQCSALDGYDRPWLDVNTTYSECSQTLSRSVTDWNRYLSRQKPFFYVEGWYENEHSVAQACIHYQAYYNILSGSTGHVFGNCPVWNFGTGASWCDNSSITWQASLNTAGTQSMTHMGTLFLSRQWHKLVPDISHTAVTAGYTDMASALTSDSAALIAYMPSNRQVTVNLVKLSGSQVNAWWYNPASGAATSIGTYAKSGTRNFTPSGGTDWVLVVDDAAEGFGAPGDTNLYTTAAEPGACPVPILIGPNPFSGSTRIGFPGMTGPVDISIHDVSGRRVAFFRNAPLQVTWNAQSLPAGLYFLNLTQGKTLVTGKLVKF